MLRAVELQGRNLAQLVFILLKPLVAGHAEIMGPNIASMPAATFGWFHIPSRRKAKCAASVAPALASATHGAHITGPALDVPTGAQTSGP